MNNKFEKSLVTPVINGQIGNQLFIISTTLAYAWDYDATPIFPALHNQRNRASYNKDHLFFRLDTSQSPRSFKNHYREKTWYGTEKIPFAEDVILDGYFQSYVHFNHHRDKLLSILSPSENTLNILEKKYYDLLNHPKTVGVHVRTSAKVHHLRKHQRFLGLNYYQKAFDQFPEDSIFLICSDRINWCKKYFPEKMDKNFVFIEGNYGIEDLFLMAKCQHNIIGNSTFSWWAGYLNQHPERRVIAPAEWDGDPSHPNPKNGLYLPDWETLSFSTEPYPEDMYHYDQTQSYDGNE